MPLNRFKLKPDYFLGVGDDLDLVIVDDVIPSARSGFRYAEFTGYLREFPRSLVLTSGASLPALEDTRIRKVIRNFKRKYPELGNQVAGFTHDFPLGLANVVYVDFLSNAYALLPDIEAANVPFVFTLYPGAGFVIKDRRCDARLKTP